jgi:hypothetical protein
MRNMEFLIPIVLFGVTGWVVSVFFSYRRYIHQIKTLTDFHAKVLDKMGSAKEFGEFLETDGGKGFVRSLSVEGPSAKTGIIRGSERAVLCLAVGIAFLLLGSWYENLQIGMTALGTIITACGIGSLISCLSSFYLSKSFGLFDPSDSRK